MKTEKICLWCAYYVTEIRPHVVYYPSIMEEPHKTTTLFLGCQRGTVERKCEHNESCEYFIWNYNGRPAKRINKNVTKYRYVEGI